MKHSDLIALSYTHPILIYDGFCILCNGYLKWLLRKDKKEIFRYITLNEAGETLSLLSKQNGDTVVLLDSGKIYTHSDVGLLITKKIGGLWPLLSSLRIIPKPIRDSIYNIIARNRYKWFGKSDSCLIPDANLKHLFLNDI